MSNARTSYDYRTVVVSSPRAGVVLATLSRPERLNAITFEMFDEFRVLQRAFGADPEARVLVPTGAGRGFCAGLDLDQAQTLPDMSAAEMLAGQEQWAWSGAIARDDAGGDENDHAANEYRFAAQPACGSGQERATNCNAERVHRDRQSCSPCTDP
jgi:enoyl-CoA hydratase/carnithine racemase